VVPCSLNSRCVLGLRGHFSRRFVIFTLAGSFLSMMSWSGYLSVRLVYCLRSLCPVAARCVLIKCAPLVVVLILLSLVFSPWLSVTFSLNRIRPSSCLRVGVVSRAMCARAPGVFWWSRGVSASPLSGPWHK